MEINFGLTSSENQYNEFVFGTDSFTLITKYNEVNNRYYLDLYKNGKLLIRSLKLVWCSYNLFGSYEYKKVGELICVSDSFRLLSDNITKELREPTKDNITKFLFRWRYDPDE